MIYKSWVIYENGDIHLTLSLGDIHLTLSLFMGYMKMVIYMGGSFENEG